MNGPLTRKLAVASVALLSIAAILVLRSQRPPAPSNAPAPRPAAVPVAPDVARTPRPGIPTDSTEGDEGGPVAEAPGFSFEEFTRYLKAAAEEPTAEAGPAARAWTDRMVSQPDMHRTYADFHEKSKKGEHPTSESFLLALQNLPPFKDMLHKAALDAAMSNSFWALGRDSGLAPVVRKHLQQVLTGAGIGAGAAHGAAGHSAAFLMLAAGRAAGRGVAARGSADAAAPRVGAAAAVSGYEPSPYGGSGAPPASGAPPGNNTAGSGGGAGANGGTPPGQAGQAGGYNVSTKLGALDAPGSETMDEAIKQWLGQYGIDKDKLWPLIDQYGLWGACFKIGALAQCNTACQNQPDIISTATKDPCRQPSDPTFWQSCRDAGYSDTDCLKQCSQQSPPCQDNQGVVNQYCVVPVQNHQPPDPNCTYVPGIAALMAAAQGGGGAGGGGDNGGGGGCSYPVSSSSNPGCVYKAMRDSGYIDALKQASDEGLYPKTDLAKAQQDPIGWYHSHPYLKDAYSNHFQ